MTAQLELGTDTVQVIGKYLVVERGGRDGLGGSWWIVRTRRGTALGMIEWYNRWRQYIFRPKPHTEYNNTCLQDIANFLGECNTLERPTE